MIVSSCRISFLPDDAPILILVEKADLALIQARLEDKETIKIYSRAETRFYLVMSLFSIATFSLELRIWYEEFDFRKDS